MQIGTTQFINTGADKATLQFCSDELTKSAGKAGLVEVIRTVTRGGRSFSQTYWVKPSDVKASDTVLGKQGADMVATHKQSVGDAKKNMVTLLSTHGRDALMAHAKSVGASWKETDNAGINWMRASMAIQKHMKEGKPTKAAGNGSQPSTTPAQQIPSGGKKPKVFTDDGGIANVSRGGRNGQYMITRKGKKQYVMLQATKKDGSWGKPSRVELFGSETPDDALKRMQRNNPDRKWQFDPDSMED